MLTSVLPRNSDPEPTSSNVPTVSAAVPIDAAVGLEEIGLLKAVIGPRPSLDTSEESHGRS